MNNTSGHGDNAVLPVELKGWNWGAFFFNWIWGIGNNSYLPFLIFIPFAFLIVPFVCGAKGNSWAWKNKKWDSIDQFKSNQRKWAIAGVIAIPALITFTVCLAILLTLIMKSSDAYKMSVQQVKSNQRVQELFGSPIEPGLFVTGSIRINGPNGHAALSYSISGPEKKGTVYLHASKYLEKWTIYQLSVVSETDDKITIVSQN